MPRVAVKDAEGAGNGGIWRRGQKGSYLSFAAARAVVWKLKLKGVKEWLAWSSSGQRPSNIPGNPARTDLPRRRLDLVPGLARVR